MIKDESQIGKQFIQRGKRTMYYVPSKSILKQTKSDYINFCSHILQIVLDFSSHTL